MRDSLPLFVIMPHGPVEVGVAAVHEDQLTRGVGGTRGSEKDDGVGDFLRSGQPLAQWDEVADGLLGGCRIRLGLEEALILIGEAFGGQYAVDADALRSQRQRPFSCERVDRTLRSGISGGVALPCDRNLRAEVDDAARPRAEIRQRMAGYRIDMQQVATHGGHELFWRGLKSQSVIETGIVHQHIHASKSRNGLLHGLTTGLPSERSAAMN